MIDFKNNIYFTRNTSSAVPEPGLQRGRPKNKSVYGDAFTLSYDCSSLYTCSCDAISESVRYVKRESA